MNLENSLLALASLGGTGGFGLTGGSGVFVDGHKAEVATGAASGVFGNTSDANAGTKVVGT